MLMRCFWFPLVLALAACGAEEPQDRSGDGIDHTANAARWVDSEFQPSTLSAEQQLEELAWFTAAAAPFRGMDISVVSETLTTHKYESEVLTRAFE